MIGSPSDQRAGTRPISFLLDNAGSVSSPVTLAIRPEDLTRTEPTRVSVNQTLGRDIVGWADFFGEGMPSVTIAGTTGWRSHGFSGPDGMGAFEQLNQLVQHDFAKAKQDAIDGGRDPAGVKLLFVDTLDNFAWSVTPTQFVLRRSKSRPLLYQYNISLQAISTSVDLQSPMGPFFGSLTGGLGALANAIGAIEGFIGQVVGFINQAVSFVKGVVDTVAGVVRTFVGLANRLFNAVRSIVSAVTNGVSSIVNSVVGIAKDIASVGTNMFRTFSAIKNLPSALKAQLGRVSSAFNEVACIFSNALRPKKVYDDYEGLYGASNCSSTTGGRPPSNYTNGNPFAVMQPTDGPIRMTSDAIQSIEAVKRSDPVLAPMPIPELERHTNNINNGVALVDLTVAQ